MKIRSYNQFCALAYALDVVGERWTLLIIRELLTGPRRFKDLMDGLPGISTNLLSERLKTLEHQGLLMRRVLPPPAGSTVYALTPFGQALETAVIELGRWGSRLLPPTMEGLSMPSVGAVTLAIKAFFDADAARGLRETYALHLGQEVLLITVDDGELHVGQGGDAANAVDTVAVFHTDVQGYIGLFSGQLSPEQALAAGLIRVEGDPDALKRLLRVSHVPSAA